MSGGGGIEEVDNKNTRQVPSAITFRGLSRDISIVMNIITFRGAFVGALSLIPSSRS